MCPAGTRCCPAEQGDEGTTLLSPDTHTGARFRMAGMALAWLPDPTPVPDPRGGRAVVWREAGAPGAQSALGKHNSLGCKLSPVRSLADLCPWSLSGAIPWPQSCSVLGGQEPLKQGWEAFSYFFRHTFSSCPFLCLIPSPRAFGSRRLGSLPATFLQVDVAFLSSLILITLEFMNHLSPKL